jgi:hypothetical protein
MSRQLPGTRGQATNCTLVMCSGSVHVFVMSERLSLFDTEWCICYAWKPRAVARPPGRRPRAALAAGAALRGFWPPPAPAPSPGSGSAALCSLRVAPVYPLPPRGRSGDKTPRADGEPSPSAPSCGQGGPHCVRRSAAWTALAPRLLQRCRLRRPVGLLPSHQRHAAWAGGRWAARPAGRL